MKRIVIVGAGFGGIATALALAKRKPKDAKIILISEKPHFEYHPGLYRVVTGRSPLEVCIPIEEIVRSKPIEFIIDTVTTVDPSSRTLTGASGSRYQCDYLVLALGSETAYFDIPGLDKLSFGFKSIPEALHLKDHLHRLFEKAEVSSGDDDTVKMNFVVVGAGASGVELAGDLAVYTKILAKKHGVSESLVTVQLIEAAPRILPPFPEEAAAKIEMRLRELGVNIFTNKAILKEKFEAVYLKGMEMKTDTVVWTAGVKTNELYKKIPGFTFDKKGKVLVDEYLQAKGFKNVFVIGDGASTLYSGMAQTAINDGKAVARTIAAIESHKSLSVYQPKKPIYALPVGPGWAAVLMGSFAFYGSIGWLLRRAADLRYFLSILPFRKAFTAFRSDKTLCETCEVCLPEAKS